MSNYEEQKERYLCKRDINDLVSKLSTKQMNDVLLYLIDKYDAQKQEPPCLECRAKSVCAVINSMKQFRVLSGWEGCDKFMELNEGIVDDEDEMVVL